MNLKIPVLVLIVFILVCGCTTAPSTLQTPFATAPRRRARLLRLRRRHHLYHTGDRNSNHADNGTAHDSS